MRMRTLGGALVMLATIGLAACGGGGGSSTTNEPFTLSFTAVDGGDEVGCGDVLTGFGPDSGTDVEVSDLRFYVSNLRFFDADGDALAVELDENEFQYVDNAGSVALIDLTGTDAGACSGDGITFPEGTARTNAVVTGRVRGGEIDRVSFDVGLPQALMKDVLANHTAEDAPSPLAEMHWSWAFAYRFFVMNFVVDHDGDAGEGYLHVGSTDCGGDGTRAMTDRDECGRINTAAVELGSFDPETDTVGVDLRALLSQLDFEVTTEEVTVPGVECHSFAQPDCPTIFDNLGLDFDTGSADADLNGVFTVQ